MPKQGMPGSGRERKRGKAVEVAVQALPAGAPNWSVQSQHRPAVTIRFRRPRRMASGMFVPANDNKGSSPRRVQ